MLPCRFLLETGVNARKRRTYGQLTCIDAMPCFLLFVHGLNRALRGVRSHSVRAPEDADRSEDEIMEDAIAEIAQARRESHDRETRRLSSIATFLFQRLGPMGFAAG